MEPLDRGFNIAVLHIAKKLCPGGYEVSDDAPDTYVKLRAHLDRTKQMLVWSGSSDNTIYADKQVNWAFRAWHDWCHYYGAHPFTPEAERAVFAMQCSHLLLFYNDCLQTRRWIRILRGSLSARSTRLCRSLSKRHLLHTSGGITTGPLRRAFFA